MREERRFASPLPRLLPALLVAAAWIILHAANPASRVGVAYADAAGRLLVLAFAATIAIEAVRAARPRARPAFVGAVIGFFLLALFVTSSIRPLPASYAGGARLRFGDAYGPLATWPHAEFALPLLGLGGYLTLGRLALLAAFALVLACAASLLARTWSERIKRAAGDGRGDVDGRGDGGASGPAAWSFGAAVPMLLGTTACPACTPLLASGALVLLGASVQPVVAGLADPTAPVAAYVEVAGPLVALAGVLLLAAPIGGLAAPRRARVLTCALALPFLALLFAGFPRGGSSTQHALYDFVVLVTIAAVVLIAPVILLIVYFGYRYRASRDEGDGEGVVAPGKRRVWIALYTFVPFAVIFALGVASYGLLVEMDEPPEGTLHVEVTAQQFSWQFTYPDGSDTWDELYVPVDEVVVLHLRSRDVIHSFYVPHLGVKMDAMPGHVNTVWFRAVEPGSYRAHCTEFCGVGHTEMVATVIVFPEGYAPPYERTVP